MVLGKKFTLLERDVPVAPALGGEAASIIFFVKIAYEILRSAGRDEQDFGKVSEIWIGASDC